MSDAFAIVETSAPIAIGPTVSVHRAGRHDPSLIVEPQTVWRATRTPAGPATVRLRDANGGLVADCSIAITVAAWGPGAGWAVDHAPELLGVHDTVPFEPPPGLVHEGHRRHPGWRMSASRAIVEALVPAILEQKVTVQEAHRAYRTIVRWWGEPAPGPAGARGLRLRPAPDVLADQAYPAFHRAGIERRRADVIRRVCARASTLDRWASNPPPHELASCARAARAALESLPGIGPWTSAIVAQQAFGDPDAVIVGDFHLPHLVAYNLAGEPRASDERMLELLEPYRGHRARAVRLIGRMGVGAPRYGPRHRIRSIAAI